MDPSCSEDEDYPSHSSQHQLQQQYKPRQYTASRIPNQPGRKPKTNKTSALGGMRGDEVRSKLQEEAAIRALKPALKRSSRTEQYSPARHRQMSVPPPPSKEYSSRQISLHSHFDEYPHREISASPSRYTEYVARQITPRPHQTNTTRQRSLIRELSPSCRSPAYSPDQQTSSHDLAIDSCQTLPLDNRYDETPIRQGRIPSTSKYTPREHTIGRSTCEISGYLTPRETVASGYQRQLQQSQASTLDRGRTNSVLSHRANRSARPHTSYRWRSSTLPLSPELTPVNDFRGRNSSPLWPGTSRTVTNYKEELKAAYIRKTNSSRLRARSPTRSLSPEPIPAYEQRGRYRSPLAAQPKTLKGTTNFAADLKAAYSRKANQTRSRGRSSTRLLSRESSPAFETRDCDLSPMLSAPRPKTSRKTAAFDSTLEPTYNIHANTHRPRGRSPTRRTPIQFPLPATISRKALSKGEYQGNSRDISEQTDASPTTTIATKPVSAQLKASDFLGNSRDTLLEKSNFQRHQTLSSIQIRSVASPPEVVERDDDNELRSEHSSSPEPTQPILKSIPLKHRFTTQLPAPKAIKSTTFTPASRKRRFDSIATPSSTSRSKSKSKAIAEPKPKSPARTTSSRKRVKFAKEPVVAASPQLRPTPPPEEQRQLIAAATILSRETANQDIQLFGEIIETDVERDKRLATEQQALETVRKAKEAKEKKAAEKAEAKAIREREKLRIAAEKAEIQRLKKETAEVKKKIQRERARKKDEANRQRELELKRQITLQKIENDRVVAKMEALLREKAQREKEVMMKSVQDADSMEKMKKNQERMRMQASGLSAARTTDPPKEDETSMFLPDTREFPLPSALKSYNAVKESIARQKEDERQESMRKREADRLKAKGEQLMAKNARVAEHRARIRKAIAMKAQGLETPPKTPTASKPKPMPVDKRKNAAFAPEESDADDDDDVEMGNSMSGVTAASMPLTPESNEDDRSVNNNEHAASPCPLSKSATTKPKASRTVNPDKAAAAKQKRDHTAREKERVRLVEEAEIGGIDLNTGELERKLNNFMAKREKNSKQRAKNSERKAAKDRAFGSVPTPTTNAVPQLPLFASPARHGDEVDLDMVADQVAQEEADQASREAEEKAKLEAARKARRKVAEKAKEDEEDQSRESAFAYVTHDKTSRPVDPAYLRAQALREVKRQRSIERGTAFSKMAETPFDWGPPVSDSEDSDESSDEECPPMPASCFEENADAMDMSFDDLLNEALDAELGINVSSSKNKTEVPLKIYALCQVSEHTSDENIDPETGEMMVTSSRDIVVGFHSNNISEANSAACEHMLGLLDPGVDALAECQILYWNKFVPLLEQTRDNFIKEQRPWHVTLDLKDDEIWWAYHLGDTLQIHLLELELVDRDEDQIRYEEVDSSELYKEFEQASSPNPTEQENEEVEMDEPLNESCETLSPSTSEQELEDNDTSESEEED